MKLLFLASAGGAAMRRSLHSAITLAATNHELRMLAPDAEGKFLRDCGVPTESTFCAGPSTGSNPMRSTRSAGRPARWRRARSRAATRVARW